MALAIQRMIEENLYWVMVNDRWNTTENWPLLKSTVMGGIPKLPREILAPIARCGVMKQLLSHGMGKHSAAEIAGHANLVSFIERFAARFYPRFCPAGSSLWRSERSEPF